MANKSNNKVAKDVKKNSKDKRHFMKDFKAELKKVIWPTPKQLFNNTVAVLSIVIIVSLTVFILDLAFETINSKGINKLRTVISNTTEETTNNTEMNNEVENNTVENEINNTNENVDNNNTENVTE